MSFCHLHIHNEFSLLDGMGSANEYALKAKELDQRFIALTNHGNIDGLLKFQKACEQNDIKPIMGCEVYIVDDLSIKEKGEKRNHATLLIKDQRGFKNLCQMLTIANLKGFYYKPRIDINLLLKYHEGLVVLSGCAIGLLAMENYAGYIKLLYHKFEDDFYLEVMPHEFKDQKSINKRAINIAEKTAIKLVATNDCHYIGVDDAESHEVLLAMQTQAKWKDKDRFRFNTRGLFLCSEKQMRHKFLKQGILNLQQIDEAIASTIEIANKCSGFRIEKQKIFLPAVPEYKDQDPYKLLLAKTRRRLQEIIKENDFDCQKKKIYQERLTEEWELIQHKGFVPYFCIVKELVDWCKGQDIMIGAGRGCFLPGSQIYQDIDLKNNIEDINIGEKVISHLGEVAIVLNKFVYEVDEDIVDIYINGALKISCTKDHKIFTNNGWRDAKDLSAKDKIIMAREIYTNKIQCNEDTVPSFKEQWVPSENYRKDYKWGIINNKRCKTNEQRFKKEDKFYLSRMQERIRSGSVSIISSEIWASLFAYLQQMYFKGKCQSPRKIKDELGCSKNSSEQARNKRKTKNCSTTSTYKRPNLKFAKNNWQSLEYSSSDTKENNQASRKDVGRPRICKEMGAKRIRFWNNKWGTISIFFRTLFFIELFFKWSICLQMQIRDSIQGCKWQKKDIQARFSNWGFGCGNKRLDERGCRNKAKICKNILQEKRIKLLYFLRKRFEEARNGGYRYKIFNEAENTFYGEQGCYEMVEKIQYRRYKGKVYDLKTDKRTYNVEGYGVHNSVGGSLVAYLLGITCVDPIKYNLLFSRFINEGRNDLPDIDMDFEDSKREQVRNHLKELYGENNIASISTFLTMKGKAVIRDVARVFDIPLKDADEFAKIISYYEEGNVISAACKTDVGKKFLKKYPQVVKHALRLEGLNKASGQHAAACIISADDLTQGTKCNLTMRKDQITSNWDMEDSEYMGLMKLDVLGLNTLSVLNEFAKMVLKNHNRKIDFTKLPLNDRKVYRQIAQGQNIGIFQISGWATNKLAPQINARDMFGLSDLVALSRPGTADSGMTDLYIERLNSDWEKKHETYEQITSSTKGIIVYQEQIMEVIYKVAGLSYSIADDIRKIISKKRDAKEFQKYKTMFVKGCLKQGYFNKQEALDFWEMLQAHASYSFNRSHSIAYAMTAYWTAWARYHYPVEFVCSLLNCGSDNEQKKKEYIEEAHRLELEIRLPALGQSDYLKWVAKDDVLYVPFIEIKGIGEKLIEKYIDKKPIEKKAKKTMKGFFDVDEKPAEKTSNKLFTILDKIRQLEDEGNRSELQKYFSFNI